jgi:aspartate/methionine/tyrosine aminotransferase
VANYRKIETSKSVNAIGDYFFASKLKEVRALMAKGRPIINLGIGNPDLPPPKLALDSLLRESAKLNTHGYQPYQGIPEFRVAVSVWYQKEYGVTLDPETEVYPLIGSKEAISYINQALCERGDVIAIPDPGYPTYKNTALIQGLETLEYDPHKILDVPSDWLQKTKVFWTNYPNMPTGKDLKASEYETLAKKLKGSKAVVVNDNPYSHYGNKNPKSLLQYLDKDSGVVELGSMSKTFHMAGWRIGYIVGHKEVVEAVARLKSHVDTGLFLPIQWGALEALKSGKAWIEERDQILLRRRKIGEEIMSKIGARNFKDQVGMFIWGSGIQNVDALVDKLLLEKDIFVVPGHVFGKNGADCIRISLCVPEEKLQECLERLG